MSTINYSASVARLLLHEGGYTNHPSDPGGPTNFGITIYDYRKYVKPGATAADVNAMTLDEAKSIYRAKYWDAQHCDELPSGVDYAVFDYGVNSGIGRSGKVLRRCLKLADNTSVVSDMVIAAAASADAKVLAAAVCDERLRFLQSLKTWDVFGKGWSRRVAEVRATSLQLAAHEPVATPAPVRVSQPIGRGTVPVNKAAQQGSTGAIATAGAAAAQQAHASGAHEWVVAAIAVAALALAVFGWLFWRRHQRQQQQKPA